MAGALRLGVHRTLNFNNFNCNSNFSHPVAVTVCAVFSESLYSHCKEEVVGHVPTNIYMIIPLLLSLPNFALDILVPGKAVKRRGGYGLQIPFNFIFVTRP